MMSEISSQSFHNLGLFLITQTPTTNTTDVVELVIVENPILQTQIQDASSIKHVVTEDNASNTLPLPLHQTLPLQTPHQYQCCVIM